MRTFTVWLSAFLLTILTFITVKDSVNQEVKRKRPSELRAGPALHSWYQQRAYPSDRISMRYLAESWEQFKTAGQRQALFPGTWVPIGPGNFGGRTLCLAFNPQNPTTIWAGSASGGLWRSYNSGTGATAWQQVSTGYPLLGVSAIAFNPADSNEVYIGTGEVYNDMNTGTGVAIRTTRGTYGIGILKSVDGGLTWDKSLDWSYSDLKGVMDIVINPLNPATVFTATTEGTFRSYNNGLSWQLIHPSRMVNDLLLMPNDTSILLIGAGNSYSLNPGIYRSDDGGNTFSNTTPSSVAGFSGKAMLDHCPGDPDVVYASIADQLAGRGLFRSNDGGLSWTLVNSTDFQTYQGWYSHDVLVHPSNPDVLLAAGIDSWKSTDGGITLNQKSYWYNWDFNATTVGGSEGPFDYVHADIHRIYRHPSIADLVYLATDGGVFRSFDFGETFEGCNGSYQTQQFYTNFSCSWSDSLFAIGGMQDNATAVYEGNYGWRRVIGGDGVSTAINFQNDQIVFGSSQYLSLRKSTDKAVSFQSASVPGGSANTCFAGPFAMSRTNPSVLYAGRDKIYYSSNSGQNWTATNSNNVLDGNPVLCVEIAPLSSQIVYASTAPVNTPLPGLFRTGNGGNSWVGISSGLPNRYYLDIAVDPNNSNRVFVAVGGYGTPHVYRTVNGGSSWTAISAGLPDVPANTVTIDPLNSDIIYLGNDLGIYVSVDGGTSWIPFSDGLTDGTLVMDITVSPANRKLRLATHGKGIWERDMLPVTVTGDNPVTQTSHVSIYPNPARDVIRFTLPVNTGMTDITFYDYRGMMILSESRKNSSDPVSVIKLPAGVYVVKFESGNQVFYGRLVRLD
jgi:hypothetical protein